MRVIITIMLTLFLPLAALMVVYLEPVCYTLASATIDRNESAPAEHEQLVAVAMGVRDFSLGNNNATLPLGDDYQQSITPDAISHLLDVRTVFIATEVICAMLLVALVVLIVLVYRRSGAQALALPLIIGGAAPLVASAVLGIAIAIDFAAFFTWMHTLFFADGTWTFPADSLLIRSLPSAFWLGCAAVWAVCMAVFCVISIIGGIVLRRRRKGAQSS